MVATLVECTNYETIYGILTVESVSAEKVQNKIYEIKNRFFEKGIDDWTIDDVLMAFPEEWEWSYEQDVDEIAI